MLHFNPLSTNTKKWSNTLKQFVGKLPTNCLSVFDHNMNLALKGLISSYKRSSRSHKDMLRFGEIYFVELILQRTN